MLVARDVQTHPADAVAEAVARGNWREAHERLEGFRDEVSPEAEALLLQCRAGAKAARWPEVERTATRAAASYPEESSFYSQWAWAAHMQGRTVEAFEIASNAADRFPKSVAIAYCLACLNGALRRVPEARHWLFLAIERASNPEKVKLRSLNQPELECIWDENGGPAFTSSGTESLFGSR